MYNNNRKSYLKLKYAVALASLALITPGFALAATEKPSAENGQWDLTDLYPSDKAWQDEVDSLKQQIEQLKTLKPELTKSAKSLAKVLDQITEVEKNIVRVSTYASLGADIDLGNGERQAMDGSSSHLAAAYGSATGYVGPTLLAMDRKTLEKWAQDPVLKVHKHGLEELIRQAPHVLSTDTESAIAALSPVMGHSTPYSILTNSDIDWPTIQIDGKDVYLDAQGYSEWRENPNRDIRKRVFEAYWPKWQQYTSSIGTLLNSEVQKHAIMAKLRHYNSSLEAAVAQDNTPTAVYEQLVKSTNSHLDTLHRYLKLRQRILGVDQLHDYDIYPPLVSLDHKFSLEDARILTLSATKPLGEHYQELLTHAMNSPWTSAYPSKGKRSGAYMNGSAYDVHPYVLTNFNGSYNDVSTYTHEWGHGLHSLLATAAQPYTTADYPIFTAEVASITNEQLLIEQMIANAKTPKEKLYYIGQALEAIRGTFFRQAQFAEFELAIHKAADNGEQLTGEKLSKMYGELVSKYYGADKGITKISPEMYAEWAYIPHFYYDFYVYQYATSIAAAEVFAQGLIKDPEAWRDRYLNVLKQGGAESGYSLLKNAGVDLASSAPYDSLMKKMDALLTQAEALLDKR